LPHFPLSGAALFQTNDPGQVEQALVRTYGIRQFDLPDGAAGFEGRGGFIQMPRIAISYCGYEVPVRIGFPEMDVVRQLFVLRGRLISTLHEESNEIDAMRSLVVPSHATISVESASAFDQLVLAISSDVIAKHLGHLTGVSPSRLLTMGGSINLVRPEAQRLRRLLEFVAGEFTADRPLPPLRLMNEFEDALITAFITSHRNEASTLIENATAAAAPWQVRATEEFIEANWNQSITVEVLAETIGASARSIFQAFKNARGYSPMVFLKRVRLNQARVRLEAPEEGTSVTSVGLACGFHNLSHFAKDYLREFGEMPSETLRRARGR
jgi:AraC-like DNA-binding protein